MPLFSEHRLGDEIIARHSGFVYNPSGQAELLLLNIEQQPAAQGQRILQRVEHIHNVQYCIEQNTVLNFNLALKLFYNQLVSGAEKAAESYLGLAARQWLQASRSRAESRTSGSRRQSDALPAVVAAERLPSGQSVLPARPPLTAGQADRQPIGLPVSAAGGTAPARQASIDAPLSVTHLAQTQAAREQAPQPPAAIAQQPGAARERSAKRSGQPQDRTQNAGTTGTAAPARASTGIKANQGHTGTSNSPRPAGREFPRAIETAAFSGSLPRASAILKTGGGIGTWMTDWLLPQALLLRREGDSPAVPGGPAAGRGHQTAGREHQTAGREHQTASREHQAASSTARSNVPVSLRQRDLSRTQAEQPRIQAPEVAATGRQESGRAAVRGAQSSRETAVMQPEIGRVLQQPGAHISVQHPESAAVQPETGGAARPKAEGSAETAGVPESGRVSRLTAESQIIETDKRLRFTAAGQQAERLRRTAQTEQQLLSQVAAETALINKESAASIGTIRPTSLTHPETAGTARSAATTQVPASRIINAERQTAGTEKAPPLQTATGAPLRPAVLQHPEAEKAEASKAAVLTERPAAQTARRTAVSPPETPGTAAPIAPAGSRTNTDVTPVSSRTNADVTPARLTHPLSGEPAQTAITRRERAETAGQTVSAAKGPMSAFKPIDTTAPLTPATLRHPKIQDETRSAAEQRAARQLTAAEQLVKKTTPALTGEPSGDLKTTPASAETRPVSPAALTHPSASLAAQQSADLQGRAPIQARRAETPMSLPTAAPRAWQQAESVAAIREQRGAAPAALRHQDSSERAAIESIASIQPFSQQSLIFPQTQMTQLQDRPEMRASGSLRMAAPKAPMLTQQSAAFADRPQTAARSGTEMLHQTAAPAAASYNFDSAPLLLHQTASAAEPAQEQPSTPTIETIYRTKTRSESRQESSNLAINAPSITRTIEAQSAKIDEAVQEALENMDISKISDKVYKQLATSLRSEKMRRGLW